MRQVWKVTREWLGCDVKGFLFLFAVSLTVSAYGQAVKDPVLPNPVRVSTRLELTLTVDHASIKTGEQMGVRVRYKNVSSRTMDLGSGSWMLDYAVTVADSSGAEPQRTSLGERWLKEQREPFISRSQGPLHVEPGADGEELAMDLAKIYQLTKPGTYFVRFLFRSMSPDSSDPLPKTVEEAQKVTIEEAVSNVAQFTITP
jgi:hypothetical protein